MFLDGYRYHVSLPETGDSRLPDDLAKRAAVHASTRYLAWSLSWKDLDDVELGQSEMASWFEPTRWRELTKILGSSMAPLPELFGHGLQQLLAYIVRPHVGDWTIALGRYLAFGGMNGIGTTEDKLTDAVRAWTTPDGGTPDPRHGDGAWRYATKPVGPDISTLIGVHTTDLMPPLMAQDAERLASHLRVVVYLNDPRERREQEEAFVPIWRRFQALCNLLQFLPGSIAASLEANHRRRHQAAPTTTPAAGSSPASPWTALMRYIQAEYRPLAEQLSAATYPVPIVGYELTVDGDVVGAAELAWPDAAGGGIALVIGGASADAVAFLDLKWTVIDADAADAATLILLLTPPAPQSE